MRDAETQYSQPLSPTSSPGSSREAKTQALDSKLASASSLKEQIEQLKLEIHDITQAILDL